MDEEEAPKTPSQLGFEKGELDSKSMDE